MKKRAYLIATVVLVLYFTISHIILFNTVTTSSVLLAFGLPIAMGIFASLFFFYVFSHEHTFPFAKEIEKKQVKAEKRWLGVLPHTSKAATVILMGLAGGPVLAAFSAQFLIRRSKSRYVTLALTGVISGFLVAAAFRGLFGNAVSLLLN